MSRAASVLGAALSGDHTTALRGYGDSLLIRRAAHRAPSGESLAWPGQRGLSLEPWAELGGPVPTQPTGLPQVALVFPRGQGVLPSVTEGVGAGHLVCSRRQRLLSGLPLTVITHPPNPLITGPAPPGRSLMVTEHPAR